MAANALPATFSTPLSESHVVISSIAAPRACWLCSSNVSASAVAILQSELSSMVAVPEECSGSLVHLADDSLTVPS